MDVVKKDRRTPKKLYTEYKCDICKKSFAERGLLSAHIKTHSILTPYQCEHCPYAGKTAKYLGRHVKRVHTAPKISCDECGKMFHFMCNMRNHMLTHSGAKPYDCKSCDKSFNSAYSLKSHSLIHEGVKPYECELCDYACRDSSTLRKHHDRHLGKQTLFPCKMCNRVFKLKRSLKFHIEERHYGIQVHRTPCDICGKMFKSKTHLTSHVNRTHARRYACKCEICGVEITTKGNLQVHMRSHTDIRPYKCTFKECGKRFKGMESLKKHSIIHYPDRQYPCDICGRLFSRRFRLKRHVERHKPRVKSVKCDLCGDSFYNSRFLAAHVRMKHVSKWYECDQCGFKTGNKASLVMHIKYGHRNEKEKVCKICQMGFKKHRLLRQHYSKVHFVDYPRRSSRSIKRELKVTVIKQEVISDQEMEFLEVHKEEMLSDIEEYNGEDEEHSEPALEEDVTKLLQAQVNGEEEQPEKILDELMPENVSRGEEGAIKPLAEIDRTLEESARRQLEKLVFRARRENKIVEMEETRKEYNKRIQRAISERPKRDRITVKFLKKPTSKDGDGATVNYSIVNDNDNNNDDDNINDNCDIVNDKTNNNDDDDNDNDGDETNNSGNASTNDVDESLNDGNSKGTDSNDNEIGRGKSTKLKINTHQCYVCYKLFPTKSALTQHCQCHFDVCGDVMLKKCPMCDYVTRQNIRRHMRLVHKLNIKLPPSIKHREGNCDGSRYYYDLGKVNVEVIPSVRNLNKREYTKIDRKLRRDKDVTVAKKRLVKKGSEWVVENEQLQIDDFVLPELKNFDAEGGSDYLSRMKQLSRLAKAQGSKILFPCEECPKICQTLSALKLHTRRHDPDAKPYKPKVWKHKVDQKYTGNEIKKGINSKSVAAKAGSRKVTEDSIGKRPNRVRVSKRINEVGTNVSTKTDNGTSAEEIVQLQEREGTYTRRVTSNQSINQEKGDGTQRRITQKNSEGDKKRTERIANRHASPAPIVNRHKCDASLFEFYTQNIRGGDVEFHQFLKIYNRMARDGLKDDLDSLRHGEIVDESPTRTSGPATATSGLATATSGSNVREVVGSGSNAKTNTTSGRSLREKSASGATTGSKGLLNKGGYTRVVRVSKKQHLLRLKMKERMRKELNKT